MSSFAVNSHSRRRSAAEAPLRVVICAASVSTRAELQRLLEEQSNIQVLGAVQSTKHLRSTLAETDPDLVFLHLESISEDMSWKELQGLGAMVVLLVNRLDSAGAEAAIAEGVQAILFGDVTGAQLATAAAAAASGLLIFSSELANVVRQVLVVHTREQLDDARAEESSLLEPFPEKLTQRELEVLEMMSEGLSNKEIAALLNISVHTAKFHISSILGKLGASSRTEATAIGLRRGLITV